MQAITTIFSMQFANKLNIFAFSCHVLSIVKCDLVIDELSIPNLLNKLCTISPMRTYILNINV